MTVSLERCTAVLVVLPAGSEHLTGFGWGLGWISTHVQAHVVHGLDPETLVLSYSHTLPGSNVPHSLLPHSGSGV